MRLRRTAARSSGTRTRRSMRHLPAVLAAAAAAAAFVSVPPQAAAAAAGAPGAATAAPARGLLSQGQAIAQARRTGKPVQVTGATTSSSTLTANPSGSLTLTEQNMPVRKKVNGTWETLDPALHRNADGSVSPAVTTAALRLSGGGTGPLVSMTDQGRTLSLTLPWTLPAPSLSGATATYADVPGPGTDLEVTADAQGDFEDVLVVKNATAAGNPALRSFAFRPSVTGGLVLRTDSHGNLTAASRGGHVFFEVPAAVMWDSRTPAKAVPAGNNPATGRMTDLRDGRPVTSAASSPGEDARTALVGTRLSGGTVTYTPDQSVLTGKDTVYPVYIDPAAGSTRTYWAQVDSAFPAQTYPKPNPMQVGYNGWESPYFVARAFVNESVPSSLDGTATDVESATLYLTDEYAPTCATTGDEGIQVWQTGTVTTSTDWSNQPAWRAEQQEKSFVHGYNSSCPAASEGFNVTSAMTGAAHDSLAQVTFGIRADSESDKYGWKQFSSTVTLSTTYDKAPNAPSDLRTSPATSCTAATPTTVGNGDVTLYATLSDPLGSGAGSLTATVYVTDLTTGAHFTGSPFTLTGLGSGSIATVLLKQADLKAMSGTSINEFAWNAKVTDGTLTSPYSPTCRFNFNPSSPGAPTVTPQDTSYKIGTPATFDVTPDASGATPTSYNYQVNGAAVHTVTASSGDTAISVTPTSGADALTVTAVAAGGNIGQSATVFFTARAPADAADGDLTGDAVPDLVAPGGGGTGLPAGLWLARGQAAPGGSAGNGQIVTSTADIGTEGNGIAGDHSPSDFTGAQVVTGLFSDNGIQDTLVYYPSGSYTGQGAILDGSGDGTVLDNQDASNTTEVPSVTFSQPDPYGDLPLQVANAYNADPNDNPAYPDLVTVTGDAVNGYYLEYYQNGGVTGFWVVSDQLSTETPDGDMNWNNWQVATMAEPSGSVDMFLYNASGHELYLWQGFSVDDTFGTASYTQYELSSSFSPGALSELRAADITGTGPALWTVTTAGTATAWTVSALNSTAGTGTITAGTAQTLLSPAHDWRLGDGTDGTIAAAADTGAGPALPLTASSSGATWTSGDLFSPAASFNGSGGYLTGTSTTGGITATSDYTVSAWIKPTAIAGVPFAESDQSTSESCMALYLDTATDSSGNTYGRWNFLTTSANATTRTRTVAATGTTNPVHVGSWTHIAVTYSAAGKYMEIYVDGIPAASATPAAVWSSGCTSLELAHYFDQGGLHAYFPGEIADVQTWPGTVLTPTEIADLSGTPGYDLFPSDSTQIPTAASSSTYQWQTGCAEMQFYQGKLTIKETCTGTKTVSYGPGGYPGAVLTLQNDGNLVIYPNAADATAQTGALWASGTDTHPGDAMFLQPDGNLVIYGTYGTVLWKTGTDN